MEELLEMAIKRIDALEKKVERYYQLLQVNNELDFIMKGTYLTNEQVNDIVEGKY